MLDLAFGVLSAAAMIGITLIIIQQRGKTFANIPPMSLGLTHGLIGLVGVLVLLLAWSEGDLFGKAAIDGLVLLGGALAGGLVIAALTLRQRRVPGGLVALHAAIAAFGYVLVAAFILG